MALPTFNGWNIVTMPNSKFQMVDFTGSDIVGINTSPWTNQSQTYDWQQSFLSATVTLPPQEGAAAAAWAAFPLACRGPLHVFVLEDSSQSTVFGSYNTNLAPDPDFRLPLGMVWSQPSPNWWIASGLGYRGSNALMAASTDNGKIIASSSIAIPVVPEQTYRLSVYMDASQNSSGEITLHAQNAARTVDYLILSAAAGDAGFYSGSFTPAAGNTTVYLECLLDVCDIAAGASVSFSDISLYAGAPVVSVASQTGYSLVTDQWAPSVNNLLLTGDYITIMSAPVNSGDISVPRLYRVTQPVDSDSSGNATIAIWPPIREVPAVGASIITEYTSGLFRLSSNQTKWNKSYDRTMSMSFSCTEAL